MKQVGRDAMKAFICQARGIELAIIHPEDLKLKHIDQKIPGRLPRRDLEGLEPLVAALEEIRWPHVYAPRDPGPEGLWLLWLE